MLVALLAAWEVIPASAGVAAVSYPAARRSHRRRKLARTRAHIAELERELGYDVPLEDRIDLELARESFYADAKPVAPLPYDAQAPFRNRSYPKRKTLFTEAIKRAGYRP